MAMRIRYAAPQVAAEHINEVTYEPLIVTNSDNMLLKTLNTGIVENENSLYTKSVTVPGNMLISFTTTDILGKLNDPRLPVFAKPAVATGDYLGLPLQTLDESGRYTGDNLSFMSDMFLDPVFDIMLFNAAEVSFLRAEAANAGITNENAQTYYMNGIRLSMTQYGIPAGDIDSYLATPAGILTGTEEERLEQIINQKWIGNYYNHYESYAEFRRTGYPRIWTGESLGVTNGEIPRRLTYPDVEYQRNEKNVIEASNRLDGGNAMTSRIWWDAKAGLPFHHPRQGMFPPEGL